MNFFTSWKTSLSGLAGGLAGVLVLTNVIPIGTGVAALAVAQTLIGIFAKDGEASK
jgi:hypothetical protein